MIRTIEPIDALRKCIDYIWVADFDVLAADNRADIVMPLGHINIIFNYGSPYQLVEQNQETEIPESVVIGQIKRVRNDSTPLFRRVIRPLRRRSERSRTKARRIVDGSGRAFVS